MIQVIGESNPIFKSNPIEGNAVMHMVRAEPCDNSKGVGGERLSSPMHKSQISSSSDPYKVSQTLFRVKSAMTSDFDHFPHLDLPVYKLLDLVVRYRVMQVRQSVNF